ncbi:MAG: hypothetical protein GY716_09220 [bacterium]|nr:hypothetical protein [bacterium]
MRRGLAVRAVSEAGFTMLQVTMLVAAVAIFAGASLPLALRAVELAEERALRDQLRHLETALVAFAEDHGRFPTAREGLAALVQDPGTSGWAGPYLNDARPRRWAHDPRGGELEYAVRNGEASVVPTGFVGQELRARRWASDVRRELRAREELDVLADAVARYRDDNEIAASSLAEIVPGYAGSDFAVDPWGRLYRLGTSSVSSDGADGSTGTEDDVVVELR